MSLIQSDGRAGMTLFHFFECACSGFEAHHFRTEHYPFANTWSLIQIMRYSNHVVARNVSSKSEHHLAHKVRGVRSSRRVEQTADRNSLHYSMWILTDVRINMSAPVTAVPAGNGEDSKHRDVSLARCKSVTSTRHWQFLRHESCYNGTRNRRELLPISGRSSFSKSCFR